MQHRQFREVIQWETPGDGDLFHRFDHIDGEIKNASKLIVQPGQGCVVTHEGAIQSVLTEAGMYDIKSGNIPFLTTLMKFLSLREESESKVAIWFFRTGDMLNMRWGTKVPIAYTDPIYTFPILLSAFGNYSVKITKPEAFFGQVVAGKDTYTSTELKELFLSRIMQPISDFLANAKFSYVDIDSNLNLIAEHSKQNTRLIFEDLGFEVMDFRIEGTQFDKTTQDRIDGVSDVQADILAAKMAGMSYAEMERLRALRDVAKNEGTAGAGVSLFAGMDIGTNITKAGEPQSAPAPQETPADDPMAKLKKLKEMYEMELISESEYAQKKKEVLDKM